MQTTTDAYERVFVALDQAGYDMSRVPMAVFQDISPSATRSASAAIAAYLAEHC